MCWISTETVHRMADNITAEVTGWKLDRDILDYALLAVVTDHPIDRVQTYLQDTGSVKAAYGRLLLRAAERSLRETGDTPATDSDKQEGDEG